jgi:hypothetical protein
MLLGIKSCSSLYMIIESFAMLLVISISNIASYIMLFGDL